MSGADQVLDTQPEEIADRAASVGEERLGRSNADILITGVIGGIEVSIGALAAMLVLGAVLEGAPNLKLYGGLALAGLVFPIGFTFVILGRSELFTENFLIPVVSVLTRERRFGSLVSLWGWSLVGNLVGCGVIAALLAVPNAIGSPLITGYRAYSAYKLAEAPPSIFVSAVLAGLVMTVLTWLVVAVQHPVVKVLAIFAAGYALFATNLSHVVVTAAIMFVGAVQLHADWLIVLRWLALATAGNLAGGVGFVTLFRLAQVKEKQRTSRARG